MLISKNTVVHLSYILRDNNGQIIDQADASDIFEYLHGHENIVTGLEKALENRTVGDKISVSITPEEGYGRFDPTLIRKVPKSEFPPPMRNPEPGQFLQIEEGGRWRLWRVDSVDSQNMVINGNHELVDQDLHFEVEILGVRNATSEEVDKGFVVSTLS